jgi:penicillin-binding protein 1A
MAASCSQIEALPSLKPRHLRVALRPQTSSIYSADGRLITTLHGEKNRTVVAIQRVPRHVRRAVVAIEDERFFQHGGVDVQAILRAAVENVASGKVAQGGSTITQQYVKNVIIAPHGPAERTLDRKIEEAALARQIERRLTKTEILERYLNTVYFGKGAYGIQAAAKTFFGRPVWKLTIAQAATLAGLIRSPTNYDPFEHPRKARQRRDLVVAKLVQLGWAPKQAAARIIKQPLHLRPHVALPHYPAPYFIDYVKRLLIHSPRFSMLGKSVARRTRMLFEGGLKIYTTLDEGSQRAAERAVASVLPYENDPYGAVVAIDPHTGYVRSMVGGRDFFASGNKDRYAKLNLAITSEPGLGPRDEPREGPGRAPGTGRQAGSAFKTFALATAIKQGIPLTKRYGARPCMSFPGVNDGRAWNVCNYEEAAYGRIPLLEATVKSVNVVYAQLILEIGAENVAQTADMMGINTDLAAVPSAVLGANPVNPLGMASAYGTLATGGIHNEPTAITKIVDTTTGKVIYKYDPNPRRVLNEATAYLTTRALQEVMFRGTGTGAAIGRPAAGKTGTAQEYRDAWFVGYTPDLVTAVWVGYPSASIEMKTSCDTADLLVCRPTRIQVSGGTWPADIWRTFMTTALARVPASDFRAPSGGLVTVVIDANRGCLAAPYTPRINRVTTTFIAGTQPERTCSPPPAPVQPPEPRDEKENSSGSSENGQGKSKGKGHDKG